MGINPVSIAQKIVKCAPEFAGVVRKASAEHAANAIGAIPNGKLSYSLRQVKLLSKLVPNGSDAKILCDSFEKGASIAGLKNPTYTIVKEASKKTPGATVIRFNVKDGKKVVSKGAAFINPSATTPEIRIGGSGFGNSGYTILRPKTLDAAQVFDDMGVAVSKKGDIYKCSVNAGKTLVAGAKVDNKYIDKIANAYGVENPVSTGVKGKVENAVEKIKSYFGL